MPTTLSQSVNDKRAAIHESIALGASLRAYLTMNVAAALIAGFGLMENSRRSAGHRGRESDCRATGGTANGQL